jgi:5-methylcytosine-specific restriction protein B
VATHDTPNQKSLFSWFGIFLKDKGLQFARAGSKLGAGLGSRHEIDLTQGDWAEPTYSANKPPRWLFQVSFETGQAVAATTPSFSNIGAANTRSGATTGLTVRILPLIKQDNGSFVRADAFESTALFVFHGPIRAGTSSEAFAFDPATGALQYQDNPVAYVFAGLLAQTDRAETITVQAGGAARQVTYGEVIDAIAAAIRVAPISAAAAQIRVYDLSREETIDTLENEIATAYEAAGPPPVAAAAVAAGAEEEDDDEAEAEAAAATVTIEKCPSLLGVDETVYRQINAALKSGKKHLMLYGPPGTGKTTLARWIATSLSGGTKWEMATGSADWSSQDIIGGYQPVGEGRIEFFPGILLRAFDRPLILDELNRCDIDKVIGPLFTVLSGQQTTLPYRVEVEDNDSAYYVILPEPKPKPAEHEFAPRPGWRLIATINSIDKASLYQMSYALARRFGWVYLDVPSDLKGFIRGFLERLTKTTPPEGPCPLADIWAEINQVRAIGAAPIIDAIKAIRELVPDAEFFAEASEPMRAAVLDAVDMVLLPMLDGIVQQDATTIAETMSKILKLNDAQADRIRRRLQSVAV